MPGLADSAAEAILEHVQDLTFQHFEDVEENAGEHALSNELKVGEATVKEEMMRRLDGRTLYTTAGYIEHFRYCKDSRGLLSSLSRG